MQRGSYVHQAIALGDALDESSIDPAWAGYYYAHRTWLRDSGAVIVCAEQLVWNEILGYAGTMDALVRVRGENYICDWKSGGVPSTVGLQTAAYKHAYMHMSQGAPGNAGHLRRACLQLKEDGTYRWHELADRRDWDVFRSALVVAQWQHANGGAK
jgi:hypothetical protein